MWFLDTTKANFSRMDNLHQHDKNVLNILFSYIDNAVHMIPKK